MAVPYTRVYVVYNPDKGVFLGIFSVFVKHLNLGQKTPDYGTIRLFRQNPVGNSMKSLTNEAGLTKTSKNDQNDTFVKTQKHAI